MTLDRADRLPPGLRNRVLAAAREARVAGRPVPDAPEIAPAEAFARAADAFAGLLASLDEPAWRVPVLRDLDVQGLVGHLVGVEVDLQRALAGDVAVADLDHVEGTQPTAERERNRDPRLTRAAFRDAVDRTLRAVSATADADGRSVALYGLRLPRAALLVVRAFELWTHENDIRAALGLPPSVPDASTLRSMTELAATLLPRAVARAAPEFDPLDLHLVLTGPGGGTWDVALGGDRYAGSSRAPGEGPVVPGLLLVVDAVDFCRLAADRLSPDDVAIQVDGAVDAARAVLAGAATLALD